MNTPQALSGPAEDILATASPIFSKVLAAHDTGEYALLAPLLSPALQSALTEEVFAGLIEEHFDGLGGSTQSVYLGSLRKEDATQLLWKVSYGEDNPEVLWQMFLSTQGEHIEIAGLLFS
jgi:hypothetical protein